MKKGTQIGEYIVVGVGENPFSTKDAGLSIWTFVKKGGVEYFMKEFLTPTHPVINSPGSAALKEKKKKECEEFLNYHMTLKNKIDGVASNSTYLVKTLDFFRFDTKYYKVTEKINTAIADFSKISELKIDERILILKTLSQALQVLHKLGIVHGDLKPPNILIKKIIGGFYTANLIDFDNSYFASYPPKQDRIVGDLAYYSPELEDYVLDETSSKASELTQKSDIFALGIIFCQYLTGSFPLGIPHGKYASNIVNNGHIIKIRTNIQTGLPNEIVELVNSMLLKDPIQRPSIERVINILEKIRGKNVVQVGKLIINFGKKELK
jgi:serine/threonine protein kinase